MVGVVVEIWGGSAWQQVVGWPKHPTHTPYSRSNCFSFFRARLLSSLSLSFSCKNSTSLNGSLPSILLNSGGSAFYDRGNGTSVLEFLYTVGEGDSSDGLDIAVVASDVTATTVIVLPVEGAIFDAALESPAVVSLPKPGSSEGLGAESNIVVDTE